MHVCGKKELSDSANKVWCGLKGSFAPPHPFTPHSSLIRAPLSPASFFLQTCDESRGEKRFKLVEEIIVVKSARP